MPMFKTTIITLVAGLALVGCAFDEEGPGTETGESLYERLGTRETLVIGPSSLVGISAYDQNGETLPCVQPSIVGGIAVLRSTNSGLLLVEDLEIELTDVIVEAGVIHSEEIHLTDLRLQLGTQIAIETDWIDGKAGGAGKADLLMDWAVQTDKGEILPLATQRARGTEFVVKVSLDETTDVVTVEVTASIEGRIGSFANRIELSDFSMHIVGDTL